LVLKINTDASEGYSPQAPYNVIVVSAGSERDVPETLAKQLAENGRMIIPIFSQDDEIYGPSYELTLYVKENGKLEKKVSIRGTGFVPLVQTHGVLDELEDLLDDLGMNLPNEGDEGDGAMVGEVRDEAMAGDGLYRAKESIYEHEVSFKITPSEKDSTLIKIVNQVSRELASRIDGMITIPDAGLYIGAFYGRLLIFDDIESGPIPNINQIGILGLVANAVDAIADEAKERGKEYDGRITLRIYRDGRNTIVEVSDNGIGMTSEILLAINPEKMGMIILPFSANCLAKVSGTSLSDPADTTITL